MTRKESDSLGCMSEPEPSVVYREASLTMQDYEEAIGLLRDAQKQIVPDTFGCRVCEDTGHTASECHHNPLVMARRAAKQEDEYRCFHCGGVFIGSEAAIHFGTSAEDRPPLCSSRGTGDIA